MVKILAFITLFLISNIVATNQFRRDQDFFCDDPDCTLNTTQLIQSKGYYAEEHVVITQRDQYILNIQRIPRGKTNQASKGSVLIQHGLLDASHTWVLNFPSQSLGFILADAGYDVWLGNTRGNTYGRSSKHTSPSDKKFWNFTFDDFIADDLPSMINYVLKMTGQSKLFYIGHSQGTMMGFAGFADPVLASKIKVFAALAPVAYVANLKVSLLKYIAKMDGEQILNFLGQYEFLGSNAYVEALLSLLCKYDSRLCQGTMCAVMGCDTNNWNNTRWPVYVHHDPAGTSVKNIAHFAQLVRSDKFQMFDYGALNQQYYKQKTPPIYDLSKLKVDVALYTGGEDYLANPIDVKRMIKELPPSRIVRHVDFADYSHIDFIWGMDAKDRLYNNIVDLFSKY